MGNTDNSRSTKISTGGIGVVVGIALAMIVGITVWNAVPRGSAGESPAAPQSDVATPSARTSSQVSGSPTREVRLVRGTGIDLDAADTEAEVSEGANGNLDLHFTEFSVYANGGGFAADQGHEQLAEQRCTEAIRTRKNTADSVFPATPGSQYCFVTSGGQYGWFRLKSSNVGSQSPSAAIVLAVRVWPKA
ncbi:hypothetical protein [Lentzea sp. NPDC059081]|uniref:hypothetical protein n=1 Tax=Lentzea sp. NPDC059081 TaxID=3346719 RepID=UPI0036A0985C